MRLLIDTCAFVGIIEGDICDEVSELFHDYENQFYISSESVKEFIHLAQNSKIKFKKEIQKELRNKPFDVFNFIENELGISVKYVKKEHLQTLAKLNLVEKHNDPSDRLIISQAICEKLTVVSSDKFFPKYENQGLNLIKIS